MNSKLSNVTKHVNDVKELSPILQLIYTIKGSDIKNKTLLEDSRKCAELFAGFIIENHTNLQESMSHYKPNSHSKEFKYVPISEPGLISYINRKTGCTLDNDKAVVIMKIAVDYINYNYNKYKSDLNKPLFQLDLNKSGEDLLLINMNNFRYIVDLPLGYKNLDLNAFKYYSYK